MAKNSYTFRALQCKEPQEPWARAVFLTPIWRDTACNSSARDVSCLYLAVPDFTVSNYPSSRVFTPVYRSTALPRFLSSFDCDRWGIHAVCGYIAASHWFDKTAFMKLVFRFVLISVVRRKLMSGWGCRLAGTVCVVSSLFIPSSFTWAKRATQMGETRNIIANLVDYLKNRDADE